MAAKLIRIHTKIGLTTTYWLCFCLLLLESFSLALKNDQDGNTFCPAQCKCITEEGEGPKLQVYCRKKRLSGVPISAAAVLVIRLDLSLNNIRVVHSDCFTAYNYLAILLLKHSQIQKIDPEAFHSLKHLEIIDLSHNGLAFIPHKLITQNQKLRQVILSNNPMSMLPQDVPILESSSLLHLDLNNCKLSKLSPQSLSKIPHVQTLDLRYNQLQEMSSDILRPLLNLTDIKLSTNPWRCNTEFEVVVCLAYNISKLQTHGHDLHCSMKNGSRKVYSYHDQQALCQDLSTPSASFTSTSTAAAPVDVSTAMSIRTLTNASQENITESIISSTVITTQREDSESQKTNTGGRSRHTEQAHSKILLEDSPERHEDLDEEGASSMATQPRRPHSSEKPDKPRDGPGGNPDTENGRTYLPLLIGVCLFSIMIIFGCFVARKLIDWCRRTHDIANEPDHENRPILSIESHQRV